MYSRIVLRKLTIEKSAIFRTVERNYKKLVTYKMRNRFAYAAIVEWFTGKLFCCTHGKHGLAVRVCVPRLFVDFKGAFWSHHANEGRHFAANK